jgi:hypothetical protein
MSKRFTLAEAQSLIPELDMLLRKAIEAKHEYDEAERAVREVTERIMMMGGIVVDRAHALAARGRRDSSLATVKKSLEEVQELGCVVKDLDIGLVDFPTTFRGAEVYLCWKLGETQIEFWHGVDEGFRGRKPIDRDFRDHHRGDRSH